MRLIKIIGFSLLGLVALLAIGVLALVLLVDPNDYKDEIARAVKEKTGRELKLGGDLGLKIFPWLAIEVRQAELGNREGFGAEPFAAIGEADVGVKLWPLLHKQLEVGKVRLSGLKLNLMVDEQGRSNWEDLGGEEKPAEETPQDSGGMASTTIEGLTIKDSALDYRDAQEKSRTRISDLSLETGRIKPGEQVSVELAFQYLSGEDDSAKPLPIKLSIPALEINMDKEIVRAPKFDLTVEPAHLHGELNGENILKSPAFNGRVILDEVSPRKLMETFGVEPPKTRDENALKSLQLEGAVAATADSATFSDMKLKLDDTLMTGKLSIADFATTALRFELKVDNINVDRYLEPVEEAPAQGKEAPSEPVELPLEMLKTLNAQGTLDIDSMTFAGMKLSAVKFNVDAKDGLLKIDPSQARLYNGTHKGKITVDARGKTAQVAFEEQLSGIEFAPILLDLFKSKRLSGKGNANMVLSATGNSSTEWLKTMDGKMDFSVLDGALEGMDLKYEIGRARALLKQAAAPEVASTGRTAFKALKASATVTDGTMENKDLDVNTDYLKATGAGKLNLASLSVDYLLNTTVLDDDKQLKIPVRISGKLNDLKVRPDVESALKGEAQKKIDEKKEEVKQKLEDKLKDIFQKRVK